LNFKFGWQSSYQALVGLLTKPSQVTKEVNRLIGRNGKDTTLSATKSLFDVGTSLDIKVAKSIWETDLLPQSYDNGLLKVDIRCVVNSGIQFPTIDLPSFRKELYLKKIGLWPTPSDIYSIVPWTWLVDWFSGLGDYIRLQEIINDDQTLINYGFMSVKILGTWSSTRNTYVDTLVSEGDPRGGHQSTTNRRVTFNRTARFNCKYELRRSIGSLAHTGTYADPLTDDQNAILTALFNQFLPQGKAPNLKMTRRM
jgi:hypothetical protein